MQSTSHEISLALRHNDIESLSKAICTMYHAPGFLDELKLSLMHGVGLYNNIESDTTHLSQMSIKRVQSDPALTFSRRFLLDANNEPVIGERIFLNVIDYEEEHEAVSGDNMASRRLVDQLPAAIVNTLYWKPHYFQGGLRLLKRVGQGDLDAIIQKIAVKLFNNNGIPPEGTEMDCICNLTELANVIGSRAPASEKPTKLNAFIMAAAKWLDPQVNANDSCRQFLHMVVERFSLDVFDGSPSISDFLMKYAPHLVAEMEHSSFRNATAAEVFAEAVDVPRAEDEILSNFMI